MHIGSINIHLVIWIFIFGKMEVQHDTTLLWIEICERQRFMMEFIVIIVVILVVQIEGTMIHMDIIISSEITIDLNHIYIIIERL